MKKLFSRRRASRYEKGGGAITALAIAFFICLNLMLVALSGAFEWSFYITEREYYTLNGSTDAYFEKVNPEGQPVHLYFCTSEEALSRSATDERVLDVVRQFSERYAFFDYSHLDIYADHDFIKKELGVSEAIAKDSVILYSPGKGHVVQSLSSFYIYDSASVENSAFIFNGEEIVATLVARVLGEKFPKAYLTVGHGETISPSMQNLLFSAGFDVFRADLSKNEIEEDCRLIVVINPLYDFEEFKDGSDSEITRLRAFVEGGGTLLVLRSPTAPLLPRLDAFCESYGLSASVGSLLRDEENSIVSTNTALLLDYAESAAASEILARTDSEKSVAAAGVTAVTVTEGEGFRASALLKTHPSSSLYTGGEKVSEGSHTVCAISRVDGADSKKGALVLFGSADIESATLLDMGGYGNESFLYALFEHTGASDAVPIGTGVIVLGAYPLTNLSSGTSRLFFAILTLGIPAITVAGGVLVCLRRKHR